MAKLEFACVRCKRLLGTYEGELFDIVAEGAIMPASIYCGKCTPLKPSINQKGTTKHE